MTHMLLRTIVRWLNYDIASPKRVLDDGDRAAVPRRDRSSQRPKGAVQLLGGARARNKLAGRLFSLPLVHSD